MSGETEQDRPSAERMIRIYLNDHLAGSVAGKELGERCLSNNPDGPLGDFLRRFLAELEEDQGALRQVIERVGGFEDPAKKAMGWVAEKIGRLKLNGALLGYSDLSRLEETEALVLGIRGKMALWSVLEEAAAIRDRLDGIDLLLLKERARRQYEEIEKLHRDAARKAFG